ncbi:MAG TPA: hypothetical protein VJH75_02490 [Patescibacteria group bacterium]|nr:hypothetical protein [Patescibacteria group bacterium]
MKNIIKEGTTPIGVQENGETFCLSPENRSGIMHLLGRAGQGKSVTLEYIIISDIHNGRSGMLIDPYGDLIKTVQTYIPVDKASRVVVFESQAGTFDENVAKFHQEINFEEMNSDAKKFLLCKLDYRTLGADGARQLGTYLVKQFLEITNGENQTLGLDEAHNFVDEKIIEQMEHSKDKGLSCILSDQMSMDYRMDIIMRLLEAANHIICYYTAPETAGLINKYHPEMIPSEILALKKFDFMVKINAKTASPATMKLRGVFPIPYPQNSPK